MTSSPAKPRVSYLNCHRQGGMLHYALNLGCAASQHIDANFIDYGLAPTEACTKTGLPVVFIPKLNASGLSRRLDKYRAAPYRQLATAIANKVRPDIVHVSCHFTGVVALVSALREHGIQVVYTLHDPTPHQENRTLWGNLYGRYEAGPQVNRLGRLCNLIHVHSNDHQRLLLERWGLRMARSIYVAAHGAGITTEMARGEEIPPELAPHVAQPKKHKILFFGRIEPYKGLDYLLAAFQQLQPATIDAQLIIAGAGAINSAIRSDNTLLINRFISDSEIKALFSYADIVVLPYVSATQTGVIPLAYSFGKPVVCTRTGSLPEAVRDGVTGTIVSPRSSGELAAAMKRMLDDRTALTAMGMRAKRYLEEELSWNRVISAHVRQYHHLLSKRLESGRR